MGCGSSSASRVCADQELEAALTNFPAQEVEGTEEEVWEIETFLQRGKGSEHSDK